MAARSLRALSLIAFLWAVTLSGFAVRDAHATAPDFGPNVLIFDPGMPTSQIQATLDALANQQVDNQFGPQRYAVLFKPGTYGSLAAPLIFQVGYYTEVHGLGTSPGDVVINGSVNVYNRCLTADNCVALLNFWRSVSNLTINQTGGNGCRASANFWAVSQGAPMRRVQVNGLLSLMDYCTAGPQFASGGFIADTQTTGSTIVNGSQQQFFVRDSNISGWTNAVWNQVFSGVVGAPAQSFPNPPYTTLATSPMTRERPFLYLDDAGTFQVFVPAMRQDSSGTTWGSGAAPGTSISIDRFYIAKPTDSAKTINGALARGQNLIFTPGVYQFDRTLSVRGRDSVVLGLGFATLVPTAGQLTMNVSDAAAGTKLAGMIFDAGTRNSSVLLQVGASGQGENEDKNGAVNPTSLHDVFFRIGGATAGKATTSLLVNSDDVLLDDIWAWRADQGATGWTLNTADTGVVVNGNNVTAYGLFVSHYQKYQVVWNGENGRTIFFQNEMPTDVPSQSAWMHNGVSGFAAYKVANSVMNHEAWGMISDCFFQVDPTVHSARAFELPVGSNVGLNDILTVSLGAGTIDHVVNDTGAAVSSAAIGVPSYVLSFP